MAEQPIFKRTFTEEEIARIADGEEDSLALSIIHISIVDRALKARDELRQAQVDLTFAIGVRTGAKLRENTATREHGEEVIAATARIYRDGVLTGSNEKARTAELDELLRTDERVQAIALKLRKATAARIKAEGRERAADTQHKALRAECYLLGQLASN
jgi:hypothetical protein